MIASTFAVDDPRRPKKSELIFGPDVPVDDQRKAVAEMRASKTNASGLPWVLFVSKEDVEVIHAPNKLETKQKGTK